MREQEVRCKFRTCSSSLFVILESWGILEFKGEEKCGQMCAAGDRAGGSGGRPGTRTQEGASDIAQVDTWSGQDIHLQVT